MSQPATQAVYDESAFRVLKGLEPVRARPGMYTRTESPTHIMQEVIDNSADEALAGFASEIQVTLCADGSLTVQDNGRGIPVGLHPEEQVPVVTLAFTRLHAGGKFDKAAGGAYAFSGGLHGVGVAVTTALSTRVRVTVKRDGKVHEVEFLDGGRVLGDVSVVGQCAPADTGTRVQAWPDASYFESPKINVADLERLLRSKAVMLPGVQFTLHTESADGEMTSRTWAYPGGIGSYLAELAGDNEVTGKPYTAERYILAAEASSDLPFAEGEGASCALAWYADSVAPSESYVNLIPTVLGGTHESGLKSGVFEALKSFIEHHGLLPRGVKLHQDDATSRMGFVLSAKVLDPQFQGQTKERLNSRPAHRLVQLAVKDGFEIWLNANVEAGKAIAELAIKAALSRQKTAQKVEKRKTSGVTILPGKLSDCEATTDNELFLVEGDSAGGSAKMARNRDNQAILPLRGKVLNTWEVEALGLFSNNEIHDISVALGVEPHDMKAPATVLEGLRYARIVIMTDADVDGAHIQTLLLTLLYRHFPQLLLQGHVHIAQPPLYRIDVAAIGKGKPGRRMYALDEAERATMLKQLSREGVAENKIEIGRFKGLGEMNGEQLAETSMDPATRRVLPVYFDTAELSAIDTMFDKLMGKQFAADRRSWMAEKGASVEADI